MTELMSLSHLTYTDLLGRQDNLEHLCEFGSDLPLLHTVRANLARVNEEIAHREEQGLTHISYAPGMLLGGMEDHEDWLAMSDRRQPHVHVPDNPEDFADDTGVL